MVNISVNGKIIQDIELLVFDKDGTMIIDNENMKTFNQLLFVFSEYIVEKGDMFFVPINNERDGVFLSKIDENLFEFKGIQLLSCFLMRHRIF